METHQTKAIRALLVINVTPKSLVTCHLSHMAAHHDSWNVEDIVKSLLSCVSLPCDDKEVTLYFIIDDLWRSKPLLPP